MTIIGVQGIKGSFSETAANHFAQSHRIDNYQLDYLTSSENVLRTVEHGVVDFGIFAIENSLGGVVIESIKALASHRCTIIDMFHIPISQNLLVSPGITADDITEIHSHRQALRQCRQYLAHHFQSCPLIEEVDTAAAARRLRDGELTKTTAVIANKSCAMIYNLELLQTDIHDLKNNLTLFLGVKKFENDHDK